MGVDLRILHRRTGDAVLARALEQANEVRSARAKLKRDLAAGEIELAQILACPPACVRTARVRDLLCG